MRTTIEQLRILAVLALLVASAACGSNGSPTAPSSASTVTTAPAPTSVVAGATIVGTLSGGFSAAQTHLRTFSFQGVTVTVVGTSVSAAVDSGGSFTLTNVPPSQVVLNFSGPGINASVPIGALADNDRVQIGVTVSGTIATLDTLTSMAPTSGAVSMKGVIASITGACPSLSFSVSGTPVQTSGATTFSAKSCADLMSGDTAGVAGTRRNDGTVLATTVDVAKPATAPTPTPPPTPPPPTAAPPPPTPTTPTPPTITMNGTIDDFVGTCPSLSMSVSGTYVRTDSATTFTGKSCGDLKRGDSVGVAGTRQSDSTILATKIVATASTPAPAPPTSPTPVTVTGTLGTFNGPCPTLSMLVSGTYVRTNASTTFSGKSCGDLKSGDVLTIAASNTGDSLGLLASKVTVTGSAVVPPPVAVTLHGTIGGFAGPCPTLSLSVSGTYVITNAATTFSGKNCGDVKIGDTVDVVGTHPADSGVVTATRLTTAVSTTAPPVSSTVTMNGTIGGVAGTCPALSMSVSGTYVRTNSATAFSGKSCGELKVGDSIGVAGAKQSDGTVLAATVSATK